MTRPHPIRSALLLLLGMFVLVTVLHSLYFLGVAHADPVGAVAAPDPVATAQAATDAGWTLVTSYGPLWAGALLLLGLLQAFLGKQHVLAQGRLLASLTGAAMTLGAVLDWHFHGAPLAGVVVTAIMAIKLIWSPTVAPAPGADGSPPARSPQAGRAGLAVLVLLAIGAGAVLPAIAASSGCATLKAAPGAAKAAVIDCARADGVAIAAVIAQLGTEAALSALGAGKIDWTGIESAAWGQGKVVGGCALAELVAALGSAPATSKTTQSFAASAQPAADGRAALERFRARAGGGQWAIAGRVL